MENYELFKYFLECYFNVSANYDELEGLIIEFKSSETEKYRLKLVMELKEIEQHGKWESIHEFVRLYGKRNLNQDKLKWLVKTMYLGLTTN